MSRKFMIRLSLLSATAMTNWAMLPAQASAQDADVASRGLEEIVVTAQKREQSLQDVPIAVTAFTEDALEANRITTVQDLSGLAPGMIVRPSAGGIATPAFTMRGQVSFGVVAGSDKQISIYLDGVYISSPRGSIFDLPDVQRIEVLRGPQGTLFGRNATGGAISITTRDPTGDPFVKVSGSIGNRGLYRIRATLETPEFGPFTGYFSFVRNFRRGDIRNAASGLVWDRSAAGPRFSNPTKSVKWLGTTDTESYFGALKFEPHSDFNLVYKYDRNRDTGSAEGTAFIGHDPTFSGIVGPIIEALTTSQPTFQTPDAKRPKVVSNGWVVPRDMKVEGHSATATWQATDNLSVKNVFAYRQVYVHATSAIDGVSSLVFTQQAVQPFALLTAASTVPGFFTLPPAQQGAILGQIAAGLQGQVGSRFVILGTQATSTSKQYSDELQVNWNSGPLQVTAGALWFKSKDTSGGPGGNTRNTVTFPSFFNNAGFVPNNRIGTYQNEATSIAAYAQLEYDITPELTAIAGGRITYDKKSEIFTFGEPGALTTINPPTYKKTKPNYMVSLNYKPNEDILVYGKFSTSFVSGGRSVGVLYQPETATSWEAGVKADLLDNRLRVNLALFQVKYKHFQSPQGTSQQQSADLIRLLTTPLFGPVIAAQLPTTVSTFVVDQGPVKAKGFELEVTAAPVDGVTLGGTLGYTDVSFPFVNPLVLASCCRGGELAVAQRPKWTGTTWAAYKSRPVFGDAYFTVRGDANYQSSRLTDTFQGRTAPELFVLRKAPGYWTFNARAALEDIELGGANLEVAIWGKNLSDNRSRMFELVQELIAGANFIPARTYGMDVTITF